MVNGEFVCLGKANEIKDKYGYGYEIDVRIKPISQINQEEILEKYIKMVVAVNQKII